MAPQPRRARSPWRWLRRLLAFLVALPLLALALLALAVWSTLPGTDDALRVAGLSQPVDIALDDHGIPRIRAANERDAATAMGVLHARDRIFQMETMRRGASGRLSEIAGSSTLRLDRTVRTLGLRRRAEADLASLPAETRAAMEAYAAGVNAWISARGRFAAPEFLLLGAPEPWTPTDSLLWGKVMGLWLSGSYRTDLERARLAQTLPPDRLAELWPTDDTPGRPDLAALATPSRLAALPAPETLASLLAALPAWGTGAPLPPSASNAWALAPARSTTGGALLASDPHLGFGAPILWYLVRIEFPDGRYLAGASSPGVPLIVIGRNDRVAWGFTTTHSDTQDVFVERLAGPDAVETPDGPRRFNIREERIPVRGRPDEVIRIRETRHGPVISDLDDQPQSDRVVSVAMANLAPEDTAAAGLHALNRARSMAEARRAAALITSPPQNLLVADTAGGIAMFLTGRTPVRAGGDGTLPAPGWDGTADWTGWVPFESLPHVVAPESGAVVNANNRVQPQGSDVFLGRDWFGDWRFRRIAELLRARPRHAPGDMAAIQADPVSLFARESLPILLALPRPSGPAGTARDLLTRWDGATTPDAPQPLIFNAWWREFGALALEAGGVPRAAWSPSAEFVRFVLSPSGAHWCAPGTARAADPGPAIPRGTGPAALTEPRTAAALMGTAPPPATAPPTSGPGQPAAAPPAPTPSPAPVTVAPNPACAALAARALDTAVAALAARFGPDTARWRWGDAHRARFEHPILRAVPLLGDWLRIEVPTPGDNETVNRGGTARDLSHVHGAGLRIVMDLGARPDSPDAVAAIIATGQSGHPFSRHWRDLNGDWAAARLLPLLPRAGTAARLRLDP